MGVMVGVDGRRSVHVEVSVPGSADEVWNAIATGEGVSSWFVPTEFQIGSDGVPVGLVCHFGPGMDSTVEVARWDPPRGFTAESEDFVPGGPVVTTEWTVTPDVDHRCTVRVEHSLSAETDEYDGPLEATEAGWVAFFRILELYLTHFAGEPCELIEEIRSIADAASGWATLGCLLGFAGLTRGERVRATPGAPSFTGKVELDAGDLETVILLDEPSSGVVHLFAMSMGEEGLPSVRLYLYGEQATAAALNAPRWRAWMGEQFPDHPGS